MLRIPYLVAVVLVMMPLSFGRVMAGDESHGSLLTNVELMQYAIDGSIHDILETFPGEGNMFIVLRAQEPSEINWLVENEILEALSLHGLSIVLGSPKDAVGTKRKGPGRESDKKSKVKKIPEFQVDKEPVLREGEGILYPEKACMDGLEGSVTVLLLVNEQGSVANVVVQQSSGEPFETAVTDGVNEYRYQPAELDGENVAGSVHLRFVFPPVEEGCQEQRVVGGPPVDQSVDDADEKPGTVMHSAGSSSPAVADQERPVLTYRITEMELRYPKIKRRFWIGPKQVNRFARVRLDFRLEERGVLLWAKSVENYVSDRVPFRALPVLENEQYTFATPEIPGGSANRYVEPLIVSGIIGGLVYLFYANQTGN